MRLLQLSDPHFGTEQAPVADALARLVAERRPDVLLLSGDITQRAHRVQFEAARRYVDALGVGRVIAIPGNHDVPLYNLPQRVFAPYRSFRRSFGDDLEPVLVREDLLLIAVKTTRRWRHKHGQVSAAQIRRVVSRLQGAAPQQLRLVVVHQPMHVPRAQDEENLLRNAADAAHAWAAAGADLVLGGHIHLPYVLPMSQRYPGLARELWCVQAGTALSARVRWEAPNSVNLVEYSPTSEAPSCLIQRWDFGSAQQAFAMACEQRVALAR